MDKTSFGIRMKKYEDAQRIYLSDNDPIILRIDGKAFHTYTKKCNKPFDSVLATAFRVATIDTCKEIQQCMFSYSQSDEVSILLNGWDNENSEVWFGGNLQKISSVSASIFTAIFNSTINIISDNSMGMAFFDVRCWNIPKKEIENYFIWRQVDACRNSIYSFARSFYSHKELLNKGISELLNMMEKEKGFVWENLSPDLKWGFTSIKIKNKLSMAWKIDLNVPDFVLGRRPNVLGRNYFQNYIWSQLEK